MENLALVGVLDHMLIVDQSHNYFFSYTARGGGILRMLQSDCFWEQANVPDLAHSQRNPSVMSQIAY